MVYVRTGPIFDFAMDIRFDINNTKELFHNSSCYYIICTDNNGFYSYVNERYASVFKFIAPDFVGQPSHVTMHPDDVYICEETGAKCYAHPGKLFPATLRKHDGKGGYIFTQWEFTLMTDKAGIPTGIFCLGYDITEYMRAQSEVNTIHKDLEIKNELLNSIAYEQSHIVRAPLANILGLINVLKTLDIGHNATTIIDMLEASSNQLDTAIRNIVRKTNS